MRLDFTDIFCGAGGSSIGLAAVGPELKLAANHWDRAIEPHAAHFPGADHLIADVSNYDMQRLPRAQVLWASPGCTWHSPAGGRKQASAMRAQLDLFDEYVPIAAGVRSANHAVEDAHHHTWPGWRERPTVPRRPEGGTSTARRRALTNWTGTVNDTYPGGWLESGGPIRTLRTGYGTRHVPDPSGYGGYDLAAGQPAAADPS